MFFGYYSELWFLLMVNHLHMLSFHNRHINHDFSYHSPGIMLIVSGEQIASMAFHSSHLFYPSSARSSAGSKAR
jgi:hypothetical protein